LPDSLEALSHLGVDPSFVRSFPLHSIRFLGTGSNPRPRFLMALASVSAALFFARSYSVILRAVGVRLLRNTIFRGIRTNSIAAVKHDRNHIQLFSEEGTENAPPGTRLPI
jgi:hypothetical protein